MNLFAVALVASRLPQLPVVSMEDANLTANTPQLLSKQRSSAGVLKQEGHNMQIHPIMVNH